MSQRMLANGSPFQQLPNMGKERSKMLTQVGITTLVLLVSVLLVTFQVVQFVFAMIFSLL